MNTYTRRGIDLLLRWRKWMTDTISDIFFFFHGVVAFYTYPRHPVDFYPVYKIQHEREALFNLPEGYQIYMAAKATRKIKGDIAEVGVYKGASAKLIWSMRGIRKVYIFDTFSGLPAPTKEDHKVHHRGMYFADLEDVRSYLKDCTGIHIYPGLFPDTAKPVAKKRFSFVHLDVDLYTSTLDSLAFFYPRMTKGGIILSHDYSALSSVKKAYEEFFEDKPEIIFPLIGSQCLVVKA